MDFYQSISKYYHHIFPLNPVQVNFIESAHSELKHQAILDIGCAIGDLSMALAEKGHQVVGIDLDEGMLETARIRAGKNAGNPSFLWRNMLELGQAFHPKSFDTIACFGNTLVHLDSLDRIQEFFEQAYEVLKENGKLLFQIIHYDRILDKGIKGLPSIDNEVIRFERNYSYQADRNLIDFHTILMIKKSGECIENCIELYPLRKAEIDQLLRKAGFRSINYFGDFKRDSLTEDSMPLVLEASK